jgi:hypothetical protein
MVSKKALSKDKKNHTISEDVSSSKVAAIRGIGDNQTIVVGDSQVGIVGDSARIEGTIIGKNLIENKNKVLSAEQAFERIGAAVRLNLEQLENNVEQARNESNQLFKLTLFFAGLGFLIIIMGVILLIFGQATAGVVTSISSIIPEVTAGLFFTKDKELRKTIQTYHQHMLESQQILTMIDVSETIGNEIERDKMKQEIIYKVLKIETPVNTT